MCQWRMSSIGHKRTSVKAVTTYIDCSVIGGPFPRLATRFGARSLAAAPAHDGEVPIRTKESQYFPRGPLRQIRLLAG